MGAWGAAAALEWGSEARDEYIAKGGRGDLKPSRLYELRRTRAAAVLVELGFESNAADAALMTDPGWCQRYAEAIVDGLPAAR
jgi:N-acetylmuramoyl-L-alanine amidase